MEIVIEIPEELYKTIKSSEGYTYEAGSALEDAVIGGTILPKGHGNLIAEPTKEEIANTVGGQNDFAECIRDSVKAVFNNAPTIIKASSEEE